MANPTRLPSQTKVPHVSGHFSLDAKDIRRPASIMGCVWKFGASIY